MPEFNEVVKQKAEDEKARPIFIFQRDGTPYFAADGKTRATLSVIGSEAETYQKNRDREAREAAEAADGDVETARARARIRTAAFAVKEWKGWGGNGSEPPCTVENLAVLLSLEHILLQAEAGIGRRTSFFADASSG